MSLHVLTHVLLDFGNSLWRSDLLRDELPGLARSGFDAVGQFGIGFYSVFMLGSQVRVTTRRFKRSSDDDADQWQLVFEEGVRSWPLVTQATGTDCLTRHGTRVSVKLSAYRLASIFWPVAEHQRPNRSDTEAALMRGCELLAALVGWLCPASEVALHAQFADAPRVAVVAPNDWMRLGQEALAHRLQFDEGHLVPLRDECDALLGRVGLTEHIVGGTLVLHGVRCGEIPGLVGLALARENNRDARRTEAAVAGSPAAWSNWAEQVVDGHLNQAVGTLLRLHPLLRDRDLPVWRAGVHPLRLPLKKIVQRYLGFRV
jgi:hypothetical protein